MARIIIVGSYAEAEGMGIKPVGSIISAGTVKAFEFKKTPPYKIVGYEVGFTYNPRDITFAPNLKEYLIQFRDTDASITISAINLRVARMIVKYNYTGDFDVYLRGKLRRVG